jgi:uncharacterized membrane protein YdjX (TVP38/TMEM64 family)
MESLSEALKHFLQMWGELSFISAIVVGALVIVLSLAPVPRTTVNIAIGAVFGFSAMPIIMVSNAIGAAVAFLLARHLFFVRLQGFANGRPRLRTLMQAVDDEGWRLVALLRLGSGVPGVVQNYLYGLTNIPLWTCTAMTLIFTIPQIWVHIYLGVVGRDALEQKAPNLDLMVTVVTVVVVLCVIALVSRRMRIALRDRNGRPVGSADARGRNAFAKSWRRE